jgi:hypothetical protein
MHGRVTTWHLLTHVTVIIQEYGWETYWQACLVALHGGTFLEAVRRARDSERPPPL